MAFINGLGRRILVNTTVDVQAGLPASLDFGSVLVSEFAGLGGMIKVDSSQNNVAQLRFAFQFDGGTTVITSSIPVNSGGMVVNELNPAPHVNISVAAINSSTPVRIFLAGVPIR